MGRFPDEHLQALEQKRKDVADLRRIWIAKRQPFMANHLERLAFIVETSVKTNMAKTTGWAPHRARAGHSLSITHHLRTGEPRPSLARCAMTAWTPLGSLMGPLSADLFHKSPAGQWMNAEMFSLYIKTQLVPTLREGDVVILDTLSSHKAPVAAEALRRIGAWFLFLPPTARTWSGAPPVQG
ncbi:MAG: hypothetical protein AAFY06_15575 [Pseudomonadota bacterium]